MLTVNRFMCMLNGYVVLFHSYAIFFKIMILT